MANYTKEQQAHIEQLLDAERNGRLVVLPCKLGDTIFVCGQGNHVYEMTAEHIAIVDSDSDTNLLDWFGDTVFLSREDAVKSRKEVAP